jgi:hypothetical protein
MAEKYWHRIGLTKFIADSSAFYAIIGSFLFFVLEFLIKWPEKYLFPYGISALLACIIYLWYTTPHAVGTLCIFHQMCYYFKLRLNSVNKWLERLLSHSNYNKTRVEELKLILREHYLICGTIRKYRTLDSNNMCLDPGLISDSFGSKLRVTYNKAFKY